MKEDQQDPLMQDFFKDLKELCKAYHGKGLHSFYISECLISIGTSNLLHIRNDGDQAEIVFDLINIIKEAFNNYREDYCAWSGCDLEGGKDEE